MKRFFVILLAGLLGLALVGGCGKKQEEQPAMEQQQQTMPADTGMPMQDTTAHDTTSGATK